MKIWFQNRRTKWKKQENISNAEAAEMMKAKNTQRERDLVKPPMGIQPPKILTENGLFIGKLSPSSSPFLRPSSSASSSTSISNPIYHDTFKDCSVKSDNESPGPQEVMESNDHHYPNGTSSHPEEESGKLVIAGDNNNKSAVASGLPASSADFPPRE